ncbi:MAG: hypothetical protein WCD20_16410 [Rhodomicrobium sp.]
MFVIGAAIDSRFALADPWQLIANEHVDDPLAAKDGLHDDPARKTMSCSRISSAGKGFMLRSMTTVRPKKSFSPATPTTEAKISPAADRLRGPGSPVCDG